MISLLVFSGFGSGVSGGVDDGVGLDEADQQADDQAQVEAELQANISTESDFLTDDFGGNADASAAQDPADSMETHDLVRGETIIGFDPDTDLIELEYSAALGTPDVTIADFPDGTGASVALNGVVVADVAGASGLDISSVVLRPV
ncbi:MAG: hypothetical protein GXP05_00595 [Alphaproteobacteria bacterium]|nr:hypothetical protein [Alphaproteobacteria bacterium]